MTTLADLVQRERARRARFLESEPFTTLPLFIFSSGVLQVDPAARRLITEFRGLRYTRRGHLVKA